jgi:hypothetical protein
MRTGNFVAVFAIMVAGWWLPGFAQEHDVSAELKAEVPALADFHEVIYPLWHEAWPSKNVAMMKELLPQVRTHVESVEKATLPGILRDKQKPWDEGVRALKASLVSYERAAAANDPQGLLDAVENLHARFEGLVRVVRPPMPELESYHVVLYEIFHKFMPAKQLASVRDASATLVARCETLAVANVPRRFAAKIEQFRSGATALCQATTELRDVSRTDDAEKIGRAVDTVHERYRSLAGLFE